METRDLERVRFITQHFNDLQGLRYGVPLGLFILAWAAPPLLRAVLSAGALLLMLAAKRYYGNTFGAVEQPQIDPVAETYPVSIFSPAGPIPRLALHRQVTPLARIFFITVTLALVVFIYVQVLPPNFVVRGGPGRHPQVVPETVILYAPPLVSPWAYPNGGPIRSPSMLRAVFTQTLYLFFGCFFLSVWLWRGGRPSQGHDLTLAVLLLGLAAAGTTLGFLARQDGGIDPLIDRLLPALVYPGVALFLCGGAMVLAGLLDHWQLARALGRPAASQVED
jgi:hypothetical protein